MSKHTPGPWKWDEPSNWLGLSARICTEKFEPVAQVQLSGWPRRIGLANAALLAAAPELLAELCHLVRLLEPLEKDGRLQVPGLATLNGARAAIARAEEGR